MAENPYSVSLFQTGNSLLTNHINKNDTSSLRKSLKKKCRTLLLVSLCGIICLFRIQTFWSQELQCIIQHEAQTALHSPSVQVNIYTYLYISDLLVKEKFKNIVPKLIFAL
ncbi:hypothetical protein KIL84_016641 [Mauremys mutica]|uniref:Uncharacterized protein n=1 Tax=Mauremys mutica TaxID=74926 RepID=A0A9D3X4U4_9SAUR|nr:hypothetical protein KIL84_016641 [Mauremys mutica]